MIKGVNRQMIEVTETGNPYFERALLVVRPECVDQQESRLHEEAQKLLRTAGGYTGLRLSRRRRRIQRALLALCSGVTGIALGIFLQGLLSGA